jgi:hypothetical protein
MNWEQEPSDTNTDTLLKNFIQLTTAITTCIQLKLQIPTLILLYSSLDIMGYLNMPEDRVHNTAQDFNLWVDKYYLPNLGNKRCRAIDLYSARCGLLHSMSYESDLTRGRKARSIVYALGNASVEVLERAAESLHRDDFVLHVDDMERALRIGLGAFLQDTSRDEKKLQIVMTRAHKMFASIDLPIPGGSAIS